MQNIRVTAAQAIKLGARYEQAQLKGNCHEMVQIDRQLLQLQADHPAVWIDMLAIRGRNAIRRIHKIPLLHV